MFVRKTMKFVDVFVAEIMRETIQYVRGVSIDLNRILKSPCWHTLITFFRLLLQWFLFRCLNVFIAVIHLYEVKYF